jgi:predicted metal-dependent hydrolase
LISACGRITLKGMRIEVEECRKLRRASACMRDAGIIQVKVPRHWSRALKTSVVAELVERIRKKDEQEKKLLALAERQSRVTLRSQAELEAYVRRINEETFQVPLGKVRIGNSKFSHLAQVNLRTKTMSVSRYCLENAPAEALRYLIVHELAHYFESGHGPRFWALVARHVPDYKKQSRIMKAFHHQAVLAAEKQDAESLPSTTSPRVQAPLSLPNAKALPQGEIEAPYEKERRHKSEHKKEPRPWAGFFKQLLLWD